MAAPQSKAQAPPSQPTAVGTTTGTGGAQKVPGITFGNKPLYIPGPNYFTLSIGSAPSSGTITMTLRDLTDLRANNTGFVLKMSDGQRSLSVKDLYIREVQHQNPIHTGAAMVNVVIEDKRALFQFHQLFGDFNKLREDGKSYRASSVQAGVPFTFDEILQKILDELETGTTAKTGIDITPNDIKWAGAPAQSMLHAMLSAASWDIALKPDGTFEMIDLAATGSFTPPAGFTIWGDTEERPDTAHRVPGTLRLLFRIYREEETASWEPVLQYDEDQGTGLDDAGNVVGTITKHKGEWDTVSNVIASMGSSETYMRATHYRVGDEKVIWNALGGGEKGRQRLAYIRGHIYKYWRFTDTDRDTKLPLQSMRGVTGTTTGRETALPPTVTRADWHAQRRSGFGPFFRPIDATGRLPWNVRVVDRREGIVEVNSPRPLTKTTRLPQKSAFYASGFALAAPKAPTIQIGYYKKYSVDPKDDYHVRERSVGAKNNGKTLTKLDPRIVLREVRALGGSFTTQNATEVNQAADEFLTEWEDRFVIPDPRQVRIAGVDPSIRLTSQVRAITWRWESGLETSLRINSDRSPDRFGLGYSSRLRSAKFAGQAEAASLVLFDTVAGAGAGKHDTGALGQTPPEHRDFAEIRELGRGYDEAEAIFVNPQYAGLLVAEDWRVKPSGETCKARQTTPGPSGPRQGKLTPPAGGTATSGGPADQPPGAPGGVVTGVG